jgi:predicted secreted hydrolase
MVRLGLVLGLLLSVLGIAATLLWPEDRPPPAAGLASAAITSALAALDTDTESTMSVDPGRPLRFPADQAPHPRAPAELWDLSGLVADDRGRRFGIRLSFIRVALAPADGDRPSRFAAQSVVVAQLAVAAEDADATLGDVRVSRAALGLAGIEALGDTEADPASAPGPANTPALPVGKDKGESQAPALTSAVWVEDWRLQRTADGERQVTAAAESVGLELSLTPDKAPVGLDEAGLLDGPDGAERPMRVYLEPRITAVGTLTLDGERHQVSGTAWLNHAWGALSDLAGGGPGRLALNRFQLQLDDGSELICLHLRRRGGGGTPVPSCLLIAADGDTRLFRRRDLFLEPFGAPWLGAAGAAYPLQWRLRIPALELQLTIEPLIDDQELALVGPVWSGTVILDGQRGDAVVSGTGRLDLSGYAAADHGGT